jgi:hypothetical protein
MIFTTFHQRAFNDYERAVYKARWRGWFSWFTRQCNDLLAFDQIRPCLAHRGQHALGLKIVPLDKIVGSEGRARDFDRAFFPRQIHTKERWLSIARAFYAQVPLPPVALVKVGDSYFVTDGHHRISVARAHGQDFVDAHITEVDLPNDAKVLTEC